MVISCPGLAPVDVHVLDRDAAGDPRGVHRDRQPLFPVGRFDLVPIPPAVLVILHIVIEDKGICTPDLIEVAAPWNVGWLQDDRDHRRPPTRSRTAYGGLPELRSNS